MVYLVCDTPARVMASKYVEFVGWRTITFFSPPRPLEPFVWVVNSLGHRMKNNRLSAVFGNPVSTSIVSRVTDVAAEVITPRVIYSTSYSVGEGGVNGQLCCQLVRSSLLCTVFRRSFFSPYNTRPIFQEHVVHPSVRTLYQRAVEVSRSLRRFA